MLKTGMGNFTRRVIIGGSAFVGALGVARAAGLSKMGVLPGRASTRSRTSLHQDVIIHASRARVYEALLSSKSFATFTALSADIDPQSGGAFSTFGGLVAGRNIELVPDTRIVQAWRLTKEWPPGVYSLVKFELSDNSLGTALALDHTGFPEGNYDHLSKGWAPRYWTPLNKFLA